MADSAVAVTEGAGINMDTRTEGTNGHHRQVVVIGDPATNAGVAPVDPVNGVAVDPKTLPPGAATSAKQDTIIGHVDGIETLLTAIDGHVDGIEGYVDGIETAIAGTNTKLDAVNAELLVLDGHIDGLETAVASTNTKLDTLHADVDGVETLLTAIDGHVDQIEGYVDGLETSNSAIQTAVQLLDDVVVADDSAVTLGTNKGATIAGVAVETDGTDPTSVSAEGDQALVRTDRNRRLLTNDMHPNAFVLFEDHTSAQTNNQLKAAPGAGLSLYITDVIFSNGATAGSIKLVEDEGGTPVQISQTLYMAINGGAVMNFKTPKRLTTNKSLGFTSATVTTHSVEIHGYIAP